MFLFLGELETTERMNVFVLVSINAEGNHMLPVCIVKGQTEHNTPTGVLGAKYTYQARAWMDDNLGVEWFSNNFLEHCRSHRPHILLLHFHSSHEILGLIEIDREIRPALKLFFFRISQYLKIHAGGSFLLLISCQILKKNCFGFRCG